VGTAHRSVLSWLSISSTKEIKEEEKNFHYTELVHYIW